MKSFILTIVAYLSLVGVMFLFAKGIKYHSCLVRAQKMGISAPLRQDAQGGGKDYKSGFMVIIR